MHNIAVFASGNGTNAENIINYFKNSAIAKVVLVISNKLDAIVLKIAEKHNVPWLVITNENFKNDNYVLEKLNSSKVDVLVLAGFLKKISSVIVSAYHNKIINLHPSLLPKYGGKGMYGINVHKTVKENGDTTTGITIHLVNGEYDKGIILKQIEVPVYQTDSAEDIQKRVQKTEHRHYPEELNNYLKTLA